MSNELKVFLVGDATKLTSSLNKASSKLSAFGKSARKVGKDLSLKLTLPIALAGGAAIKLASDFEESLNKVDVAFGKSSAEVKNFAKTTLTQFGIAEGSALDMAALFGDMATSMGITRNEASLMSTSMVGLAGDLASFKNIGIDQATTALAGVFTGETESLKRLGIVMTEVNLKQFAMSEGIQKNIKDMTQAEKVNLRYEFILSKTGNAQGDFARTQEGAANQMRIFSEGLKQLGQSIGSIMLPAFTKIVSFANKIIEKFIGLDDKTKKIIVVVGLVVSAIGPFLFILGSLSSILGVVATGFTVLTTAMMANPFVLVGTAIVGLVAIFVSFVQKLEPAISKWQTFLNMVKSFGSPAKFAALQLKTKAENLKEAAKQAEKDKTATSKLKNEIDGLTGSLKDLNTESQRSKVSGIGTDSLKQPEITAQPIIGISSVGKDPASLLADSIQNVGIPKLNDQLNQTNELLTSKQTEFLGNANEFNQKLAPIMTDGLNNLAVGIGEAMGSAIAGAGNMGNQLAAVLLGSLGAIVSQVGKMAIGIGIGLESIKTALKSLNPVVAIAAGVALVALGAFFKAKSADIGQSMDKGGGGGSAGPAKFANGGIVSAPTLGLVGEYTGAKSNPEVIAPLDKLKGMIGDRGSQKVDVGGSFTLKGQDLVVALQRANTNRNRII
jgi:hypothetical protein